MKRFNVPLIESTPPTPSLAPSPTTHISCWPRLDLEHGEQSLEGSFLAPLFSQPDGERERVQVTLEVRNARVGVPGVSALEGLMLAALCDI